MIKKSIGVFYLNNGDLLERVKGEKAFAMALREFGEDKMTGEKQAVVRDIITSTTKLIKFEDGTTVELIPITHATCGKRFNFLLLADSLVEGDYKQIVAERILPTVRPLRPLSTYQADNVFTYDKDFNLNKY